MQGARAHLPIPACDSSDICFPPAILERDPFATPWLAMHCPCPVGKRGTRSILHGEGVSLARAQSRGALAVPPRVVIRTPTPRHHHEQVKGASMQDLHRPPHSCTGLDVPAGWSSRLADTRRVREGRRLRLPPCSGSLGTCRGEVSRGLRGWRRSTPPGCSLKRAGLCQRGTAAWQHPLG